MISDSHKTSVGMEYFCSEGDDLWSLPNEDLVALATNELAELGLCATEDVVDNVVIRQPMAYPVYDEGYSERLRFIQTSLESFENLPATAGFSIFSSFPFISVSSSCLDAFWEDSRSSFVLVAGLFSI